MIERARSIEYTYIISLDDLNGGDQIFIAAQAEVTNTEENSYQVETAWGQGTDFPGHNWAMYFTYEVQGGGGTTG